MFLRTTGIILVLCLWNVFVVVVEGQSSCGTTVGTCKKLVIVHQRYGWQTYTHYIIVHYSCDIPCINGNWGSWSPFSDAGQCSVTCCQGTVTQRRTRECNNPPPSGGGAPCPGADTETRTGSCGSNDNQCPLTCVAADLIGPTRFGDTCVICVNRYYQCNNLGPPDEMFCGDGSPGSLVWSVNLNTCIAPAACIAQGG